MNLESLFIITFGSAFSIIWLIRYVPLVAKIKNKVVSPRLTVCKILAPFDATFTVFLVVGSWVGLSTTVTGLGMMVFNVLTGIGLSIGVLFMKKVIVPLWEKDFRREKEKVEKQ